MMGVEYEGGWRGTKGIAPFAGATIKYDGSVNYIDNIQHYGEIASDPMEPIAMIQWAKTHVPHAVNGSCGTHVHISFDKRAEYAVCVNRKYMDGLYVVFERFANSKEEEHPVFARAFKRRLAGENHYCHKRFAPIRQLQDAHRDSSRYSGVNYCHKLHGTIEIRVLPGIADAGLAEEVLHLIIQYTNAYIRDNQFKKRIRFRR
jgi:hypothetical protein